jgi:hypothetical protein
VRRGRQNDRRSAARRTPAPGIGDPERAVHGIVGDG